MGGIGIEAEGEGDAEAIGALTRGAFENAPHASGTEDGIVAALRRDGALTVSLVAREADGTIVGHVAFSPVRVEGRDVGWHGLGPVSVRPDRQGEGIGARLVREGLARLAALGSGGCVVLGEPAYYGRFGFEADPALVLPGVPAAYFQRLVLSGAAPAGAVSYHPAFGA